MKRSYVSGSLLSLAGLPFLLASAFSAGCAADSAPVASADCDSTHVRILKTVLDDGALKDYGKHLFDNDKVVNVVWHDAPSIAKSCKAGSRTFALMKSSPGPRLVTEPRVVVTKIYYDETAAFVEVLLYPTGMHADFFLRNEGGWKVAQRSLWES